MVATFFDPLYSFLAFVCIIIVHS